jgi:hypothetical protein
VHSPLSYCHYAKIFITDDTRCVQRSVHYYDVSTRYRLTTTIKPIPTKGIC